MDIRNPDRVITKQDLKNFYDAILPYLGGIPEGGEAGQVLKKKSDQDGDVEWADDTGGGGGESSLFENQFFMTIRVPKAHSKAITRYCDRTLISYMELDVIPEEVEAS